MVHPHRHYPTRPSPKHFLQVGILALLALSGCETLDSSQRYYQPSTQQTFQAKPKDAEIPIYIALPRDPHTIIGRMEFASREGEEFMLECLRHNARRAGADAVVLLQSYTGRYRKGETEAQTSSHTAPPHRRSSNSGADLELRRCMEAVMIRFP